MKMSILEYPEGMATSDLQIWNNLAYDGGVCEDAPALKTSWSPLRAILVDRSDSFDSGSSKENQSPAIEKRPLIVRSPTPVKPLHPSNALGNSLKNSSKKALKQCFVEKANPNDGSEEEGRDATKIDAEIEEIESEIKRLTSRLEALRMEKVLRAAKISERKGKVVPAKFMESKQSEKSTEGARKIEETLPSSVRSKVQQRRITLGPAEIIARTRRGMSLGPSEIASATKRTGLNKLEVTPVQPIQSRRKSCFWKLHGIDEEPLPKERGILSSLSPKSRKTGSKAQDLRQAVTTVGGKKFVKKEDGVIKSIQPKRLFRDGEKSAPVKKPIKPGRVVASRYQTNVSSSSNSVIRKRSLPENAKDETKQSEKKRSMSAGKSRVGTAEACRNQGAEARSNKRWEIPSEVAVYGDSEGAKSTGTAVHDLLPRIRTLRCPIESPRDSGPAKRVADLVGRKSFFSNDEEIEPPVCQALSFAEAEQE